MCNTMYKYISVGAYMFFGCKKGEFDRCFNRSDRPAEESRPDRPVDPTGFHFWSKALICTPVAPNLLISSGHSPRFGGNNFRLGGHKHSFRGARPQNAPRGAGPVLGSVVARQKQSVWFTIVINK